MIADDDNGAGRGKPPERLEALSRHGDPLEVLERTVDFEYFRGWLVEGLG